MNIRLFGYLTCIIALGTLLSCEPQAATTEEGTTTASSSAGNIVFIRLDSLTNQYASLSEKTKALEARAIEADKGQNERVNAFQRDVQNYQRRANSGQMSPKDMGNEQERLAGREQALMQEAERLRQELQLEQMKLSAEFEENLMKVLEEIQDEFNYDYILSYGNGTGVLMVSDKNDITPEVAKRLNTIPMDGQMDSEIPTEADAAAPATEEQIRASMPTQIHLSADPNGVARDFTRYLLEQLQGKKHFTIALSGGSTPKLLFRLWATEYQDAIDWSAIHFFWGDERCVQPDDDESNFGMTKALLFDKVNLPVENIHRVRGEDEPEKEACRYAAEIADNTEQSNGFPSFDLVILGMGDDGHTASIFPHEMELLEEERFCAVATHPTSGQKRVSITGPVINNAQRVAFLVTGANKEEKVSAIFQRKEGYHAYPAAHVQPVTGALHWFLDDAAMY